MNKIVLTVFFVFINILSAAQIYKSDTAVSSGAGGAYTAVLNTPESLFFNPADFYSIKKTFISLSYNQYLTGLAAETSLDIQSGYFPADIASWNCAVITPVRNIGAMGFAVSHYSFSRLYGQSVFYASFSFSLNQLMKMNKKIGIGLTAKYIMDEHRDTLYHMSAETAGFSFDAGTHFIFHNLQLGISILDLFSTDMGINTIDKLYPEYKLGVLYSAALPFAEQADFSADFSYQNNQYNLYTGAVIYFMKKTALVRAGANFDYISFGASYILKKTVYVHYAVNFYISNFSGSIFNHKISIGVKF